MKAEEEEEGCMVAVGVEEKAPAVEEEAEEVGKAEEEVEKGIGVATGVGTAEGAPEEALRVLRLTRRTAKSTAAVADQRIDWYW